MFPSWNSIKELEDWHDWADNIGHWWPMIFGAVVLVIVAIWTTYNRAVDKRLAFLIEERDARNEQVERDERDSQKRRLQAIPDTSGLLTPGDGEMPSFTEHTPEELFEMSIADVPEDIRTERIERKEAFLEMIRNTPPLPSPNIPDSAVRLYFGDSFTWTDSLPIVVVGQGNEDMITLETEGDGLALSAKFFDAQGKVLCEVVKNKFQRNPNNTWRMEVTDHRLTVLNDELREVIDLEFVNPHVIRLLGNFYLRRGFHMSIKMDQQNFGGNSWSRSIWKAFGGERPVAILVDPPDNFSGRAAMAMWSPGAAADRAAAQRAKADAAKAEGKDK